MATNYIRRDAKLAWSGIFSIAIFALVSLAGCQTLSGGNPQLTSQTYFELVDWHISGLWVINCPVAWVRLRNYNPVPIKEITLQYNTYDYDGTPLDQGTYTIEGSVPPNSVGNFAELYLGPVNLHSDKLSVKLLSVKQAD